MVEPNPMIPGVPLGSKTVDRDGRSKILVSSNGMEATVIIEPPTGEGKWPTKNNVLESLRAENVNYGLIDSAIDDIVKNQRVRPTVIARGKPPVAGKDAELSFLFESGVFRRASIEDETGRVDYRQLQTIQNVVTGQVIVEKTPATPGIPGFDVRGNEIPPVPGKDKLLKLGKNVVWTADNLKLVATSGGEPSLVNNRIGVQPVHELKGNVDFNTGNIVFSGNLVIHGNIESGFKVEAEGDVTIYGNIDSADIKAGGNLFIQGGVSGMDKTSIYAGGDVSAKYIEHASLTSEGSVTAKEAIMYCQVNADAKVLVEGGKGLIVGGLIRAGEEISAKTIGSRLGTVTELEVGISPKTKLELQEIESQLSQNNDSLDKAEKAIVLLSKIPELPMERKEMLQNLVKTSYALKSQIAEAEGRRQQIVDDIQIRSKERGRIKIKDTIYPGVRVTIGKTTIMIQDEIKFAQLVYCEGEIQIQPFR